MRQIKKRSPIPLYGMAAVWLLYCIIFPLYRPSDFCLLIASGLLAYAVLSKLFPGTVETVEEPPEPVTTGNEEADALLREGETAVLEMRRLRSSIKNTAVCEKIDILIDVTDKIFKDIIDDPSDIPQVKRFAGYYLPATMKLLNAYDRMSAQNIDGENISATLGRIEDILDTTVTAYKKQLDALFANQALDIETDITVLEAMLKREGLSGKDF
ncbi:MAG: 5-bromo-4-chloroindolyl phosphate hydrolysis family protein [Oscillospiraceae bacterium]